MRIFAGLWARVFTVPTVAIASVTEGRVVTVRGEVVARDLIDSPLAGKRCVYYRFRSEQWRQSRVAGVGGDGFWEATSSDEAIVEFYVADQSGRAIVSPANARVQRARGLEEISTTRPTVLSGAERAQELLIVPGDEITVTGEAAWVSDLFDDGRDYRQAPRRLMLRAPEGKPLQIRLLRQGPDQYNP